MCSIVSDDMEHAVLSQKFQAIIERDEDGFYVARVPALPGCHTQAKTLEELRVRLKEAISLCLEQAISDPAYRSSIENAAGEPTFVGLEIVQV